MEENKRYDMVNILRVVCALLVMSLHLMAFACFGDDVLYLTSNFICRIAVPFFFITAGYFFYSRYNREGYVKKYLCRLIGIYAVVSFIQSLVFFPFYVWDMIKEQGVAFGIKVFLVNGVDGALWYFPALIISTAVVYIFLRKGWTKQLICLSTALFLIGLMGDSYYGLVENTPLINVVNAYDIIFDTTRNGITFGVPYLTIGVLINKYSLNEKIKNLKLWFVLSWALFGAEAAVIMNSGIALDYNIYFSVLFVASFMFMMALNSNVKINADTSRYMREMSVWIYCFHTLLSLSIYNFTPIQIENTFLYYLFVAGVVITLSFLIAKVRLKGVKLNRVALRNTSVTAAVLLIVPLVLFFGHIVA